MSEYILHTLVYIQTLISLIKLTTHDKKVKIVLRVILDSNKLSLKVITHN